MTAQPDSACDVVFDHVTFGYNGVPILRDVSVRIQTGDFACVVGPNGSGKTTLLRLMLGLLKPRQGEVRVLGRNPARTRGMMGYMPQHTAFDPSFPATVYEVARMGRLRKTRRFGPYSADDKAMALRSLEETGVADLRDRPFAELSGGQRQRVLIARALACEPRILVLDEPAAGLDAAAEHDFYELLRVLNERMSIVVVSHDLTFVSGYVKTVVCIGIEHAVHVHSTSDLTDDMMHAVYGRNVRMVVHGDHAQCAHAPEEDDHVHREDCCDHEEDA